MQFTSTNPPPDQWLKYFAVSAQGIEAVTAAELASLGAKEIQAVTGGVEFAADLRGFYRALLWLRTATRVLRPLREFAAIRPDMLYSQVRRIRWEDFLNPQRTFAVQTTMPGRAASPPRGSRSAFPGRGPGDHGNSLGNPQFASLKIKDAIVDRLRREQGERPNVDRDNPDVPIHAHLAGGRCTLSLDAVGRSLHERGYREDSRAAPLKETLAAAIVLLTGWDGSIPWYDPMCGSGTLVLEAALFALRIAPGLRRESFPCHLWPDFRRDIWEAVVAEARGQRRETLAAPIFASDTDDRALAAARAGALAAGLGSHLQFFQADATTTLPPTSAPGVLVINPPYGERLGNPQEIGELYRRLGLHWRTAYPGWCAYVLAGNLTAAKDFPLSASRKIKLRNGPLECRLLQFDILQKSAGNAIELPVPPTPPDAAPPAAEGSATTV